MRCFKPCIDQFIFPSDIKKYLKPESSITFFNWLENWNSQFFPVDLQKYCPNLVQSQNFHVKLGNKRLFLEVFKFLEVSELVLTVNRVDKKFY